MLDATTDLALLHADDHLLVWSKPSGLHTVPAKPPGPQDCLVARAEAAFPGALLVHRLDREAEATRLELTPLSGRSHQLRVHCLALGHPILGDPLYGDPASAPRLQLHAASLGFRHPDGGAWRAFAAPVPF